jgi:predicted AlkP superfamily phosphohydrolase/phosphomutase
LVIGLDGGSPDLIRRWADEGKLPNLARLIEEGTFGHLRSTYPPISAAAWVTFLTGQEPGQHGIFDFRNYDPTRYTCTDEAIVNSTAFAGRTMLDVAGSYGRRVGAVTVPITYPTWPVNGAMVAGYPTPDAKRAFTYPPELGDRLGSLTEDSAFFRSRAPDEVARELIRLVRDRAEAARWMLENDAYDLFVVVFGATDRAQHDFWRHFDPGFPTHDPAEADRFGSVILEVYQEADRAVGRLLEAVPEETTVLVMSDHGAGPRATRYFHLNAWLTQEGLLQMRGGGGSPLRWTRPLYRAFKARFPYQEQVYRRLPAVLKRWASRVDSDAELGIGDVDWGRTVAYRFPMYPPVEGIVVNLRGRQPEGIVEPGAGYERLRDEIIDRLQGLTDPETGEPVVEAAFRREDLYRGDHLERVPDIVVVMSEGYEGGSALSGPFVTSIPEDDLRRLSGAHRMDGVLIAHGPAIRRGEGDGGARIVDLAPTILYALGVPVPSRMDGRVLVDLFEPGYVADHPVERVAWRGEGVEVEESGLSEEEESVIREKLRRLGYIE